MSLTPEQIEAKLAAIERGEIPDWWLEGGAKREDWPKPEAVQRARQLLQVARDAHRPWIEPFFVLPDVSGDGSICIEWGKACLWIGGSEESFIMWYEGDRQCQSEPHPERLSYAVSLEAAS